jgi:glutamate---cysteine ligase / carboxylate-amine ligase
LEEGKLILGEKVKPEMIQSMIEVGTGVCANIQEAREDISKLRCIISNLARKKGKEIVAASTHPFSKWSEQEIYEGDRYRLLVDELQMVARSLLIFGVHVHVGVADLDRRIHIMNAARYFLPHVLAMTTSSPFWLGFNTGLNPIVQRFSKSFPARIFPIISNQISSTSATSICS